MPRAKVVFVGQLPGSDPNGLADSAPQGFSLVTLLPTASMEEMLRELEDADFLICRSNAGIKEEVYRAAKRLKLVQTWGMGYDALPMPLFEELGIPVANIGGANAIAVAEHAVTLMLMVFRRMIPSTMAIKQGRWRGGLDDAWPTQMYQKTVGIVGLGNIGRWVGRIVNGFGAHVIFYDVVRAPQTMAALIPGRQVALDELLRTADIVSLHVPLDKASQKMIGQRELALMKPSAILINTCRGRVVDETALIEALKERLIAGAGLDVFEQEPIGSDNPLLQMENVVCTPHMASRARENIPERLDHMWGNLEAVLAGVRPLGLVNDAVFLRGSAARSGAFAATDEA